MQNQFHSATHESANKYHSDMHESDNRYHIDPECRQASKILKRCDCDGYPSQRLCYQCEKKR